MKRKLIQQGLGGFTIYLPKKWIDRKHLKAGNEIDLTETDAAIIITSEKKQKHHITLEITDQNKHDIQNILTHLYRRCYDSITIKNTDQNMQNQIKKITNNLLLGFEITKKNESECHLENISEPTEEKYEVLLRRIFLIIKETQSIILNDFEKNQFKSELDDLRQQTDKYILFCRRTLAKEKYQKDPMLQWELLTFLMHIQHAYYYLYKYAKENKIIKETKTISLIKDSIDYFQLYYDAYFKKDIKLIHKINRLRNEYQFGKCLKIIPNSKNPAVISYLTQIFRLIQIGTSPVLSELTSSYIS